MILPSTLTATVMYQERIRLKKGFLIYCDFEKHNEFVVS